MGITLLGPIPSGPLHSSGALPSPAFQAVGDTLGQRRLQVSRMERSIGLVVASGAQPGRIDSSSCWLTGPPFDRADHVVLHTDDREAHAPTWSTEAAREVVRTRG